MIINSHSYYSLHYGTLSVEKVVQQAMDNHMEVVALTDINNSSAAIDFVKEAQKKGVHPVVGVEFRNGTQHLYTALAKNNAGFYAINHYLSSYLLQQKDPEGLAPRLKDVIIVYPMGSIAPQDLEADQYIGVLPHQVNQLLQYPRKWLSKFVAQHTVTYEKTATNYHLHKILRAIALNTILPKLSEQDIAPSNQFFVKKKKVLKKYALYPELVDNAKRVMDACCIRFDHHQPKNKTTYRSSKEDDIQLLRSLALKGFQYRYDENDAVAKERLDKELDVIERLDFSAYFLIVWDVLQYAQKKGLHHVGRGSGANSIVAYCLKITDVDPIALDLYFERFINPHRTSPPDFDVDFSWDERDGIIEYIFHKYGEGHVALIATVSTFKGKSSVREVAKAFGMPKEEIDRIIHSPEHLLNLNKLTWQLLMYAKMLEGFPNHLGIHAGGILISEEPLYAYSGLQMMPKGFPIVQWDMYVAEDMGFHKFDILSQRGLGHIKEAVDIIQKNRGEHIDIHRVKAFMEDAKVKSQLRSGDTIGCFYIESPAMRGLLNKLRCDNYLSLIAASSIIRPGVAKSGMMRQYIERFHNKDFEYLHPIMEKHLGETYGIMIYQEDVIKIAHHFAGVDLADADILRRAMSGKFRSKEEMQRIIRLFFENCKERGYSDDLSQEVWRQIESFSGYSFSKAHSASYAVESFQSLYLKAHYPLEFMVAVINNRGGFYSTEFYVHEARLAGGVIHEPCVNNSEYNTCIDGMDIYLGLSFVKELERNVAKRVLVERMNRGLFLDLLDFIDRVQPSVEQVMILIKINALRFTGLSKKQLIWQAQFILKSAPKKAVNIPLFTLPTKLYQLPVLTHNPYDDVMDQIQLLDYPLCSPFSLVEQDLSKSILSKELVAKSGQEVFIVGYYVNEKRVKTANGRHMKFGCFIDIEGKFFDAVIFPDVLQKYPLQGRGSYYLKGKVALDFGYPSLEVIALKKLALKPREAYALEQVSIAHLDQRTTPSRESRAVGT